MFRHGCSLVLITSALAAPSAGDNVQTVRTRVFEIEYAVNDDALPLESVQLWYTTDEARTWHLYGTDGDGQSPVTFHAPQEGLTGFYVVAENATAPSSPAPSSTTEPHTWAFVDFTPPVVQMHALRRTTHLAQRVIQIRWTAIDANLGPRPIEIAYRATKGTAESWEPATVAPVANTGRLDWRVPENLTGSTAIRITVRDKGGHVVTSEPRAIDLTGPDESERDARDGDGDPLSDPASKAAQARARKLYERALELRDQGKHREGIARLREAVRVSPGMTDAFAELAGMLYGIGDYDRSIRAYEIALKQAPTDRKALRGSAMVYRKLNDYTMAASQLREILRLDPADAEVWMNLGDVAVFQGDELTARQSYRQAVEVDPEATDVIEDAKKRLTLMAQVSRTYHKP